MKLYRVEEMKAAEHYADAHGLSYRQMMENAGRAAAELLLQRFGGQKKQFAVLCGKGNNGGDGLVVARLLHERGERVQALLPLGAPLSGDAAAMLERLAARGLHPITEEKQIIPALASAGVVVDAVFGTGFHGEPPVKVKGLITLCREQNKQVVALDIPSGVCADTGEVAESFEACWTITFHAGKPGQFIYPGAQYCGEVTVCPIGIPDEAQSAASFDLELYTIQTDSIHTLLPRRPANSNKGTFGRALCVCGSYGMAGAAVLAAKAAAGCGAGLVELMTPESVYPSVASVLIEQVICPCAQTEQGLFADACFGKVLERLQISSACLFGPGVGQGPSVERLLSFLLTHARCPVVIDADGINALARNIHILNAAKVPVVLTPHPGEMGRLAGLTAAQVQEKRLATAGGFAQKYGVTVVLKGAHTLVAHPGGQLEVNLTGNDGMAKAGSGDVLAGMLVSFLAQGMQPAAAADAAVHLHGLAGDRAAAKLSRHAMSARDLIDQLPALFLELESR